jgi:hypothetical protein
MGFFDPTRSTAFRKFSNSWNLLPVVPPRKTTVKIPCPPQTGQVNPAGDYDAVFLDEIAFLIVHLFTAPYVSGNAVEGQGGGCYGLYRREFGLGS